MPTYQLILAHGEGEREHITYDSGDTQLALGKQLSHEGVCWQVVAEEDDALLCGPCLPLVVVFGNHELGLFHADARELIHELRQEAQGGRPAAGTLADEMTEIIDDPRRLHIHLNRDMASALRWAIHRLEISAHELSPNIADLRIELHRYLEDTPAQDDAPSPASSKNNALSMTEE